ncbi:hypothetical protein LDL08_07980 [Nonomuraea glycinis]|uniref:hypothetical protein n=1 Tax=Nonomuraea glycinis TaxID=2047744 RepID=UPI00166DF6E3|nr:hypothetical protein [Nonomuraea glycinis]MCA2176116.1 hypothetical protein [Nonomuraea glycinis]
MPLALVLVAAGPHPPFHDGVHPRHPNTGEHRVATGLGEDLVHDGRELPIPVSDQEARSAACVVQIHHQVPDRLGDPVGAWVSGGTEDANAPGGVLDDGQDVLALPVQGDGLNEIAGQ